MRSLDARVDELEARFGTASPGPAVIMISVIDPKYPQARRVRAECGGVVVLREADETDDRFPARALATIRARMPDQPTYEVWLLGEVEAAR